MKFGVLIPLIIYYGIMALLFTFGSGVLTGYTESNVTSTFTTDPGVGSSSLDFFDYIVALLGFLTLGIGLPTDTPLFIQIPFTIWSISLVIITIAMIYQALRAS